MISLQIKEVKAFMAKLLMSDMFDSFLLEEAVITTYNTFHIDGRIIKEYFSEEELESSVPYTSFSEWMNLKPVCFDLIKGKKTPVSFQFTFHANEEKTKALATVSDISDEQVKALVLNVRYSVNGLYCITGTAFTTFVMDKSLERAWDDDLKQFLLQNDVDFDEM